MNPSQEELLQARKQAIDAEKNIKALLDANTQSILLLENDATVIHVNQTVAKILNTTPEDLKGKDIFACLSPDLAISRRETFNKVVESGQPAKSRDVRDGRIILHSYYPILENGKVIRVALYAEDITEVISKERDLKRSRQLQNLLYEIIGQFNTAGTLSELMHSVHRIMLHEFKANNFYIALIDAEHEELVFTYYVDEGIDEFPPVRNIYDPANKRLSLLPIQRNELIELNKQRIDAEIVDGNLEILGRTPEIWIGVPMQVGSKSIGVLVVQDYDDPDKFSPEDIQFFSACSQQIAQTIERKKYDFAMRESAEQYRALFEDNHSVMLIIEPETGNILDTNKAAANFYGYTREELKTQKIFDLNALSREEISQKMGKAQRAKLTNFIFQHRRKCGDIRDVEVFSGPFKHSGRTRLISIIHDITTRLKNERELSEAKEAAIHANKAKDEFLANISHEIRTPLNGVMGMLQLMDSSDLKPEHKNCISVALQSSRNLLRVLNDILDLSKVEMGTLDLFEDPFSLRSIVMESVNLFKPQAKEKGLELSYNIHPEIDISYAGDEGRIRQILFNLVGNSIKFTDHGSIKINVEAAPINCLDKQSLSFSVSDTGVGIPQSYQERIFDSFTQVDGSLSRRYKGAGLGLSIVKRLIELMDGSVEIDSTPNVGTSINFTIALKVSESAVSNETAQTETPSSITKLKILLVEDEPVNRMMAQKILERMGHRIVSAENGLDCLKILGSEYFDAILMDIQMPVMDGLQATRTIRTSNDYINVRDIPIIALSAHANKESRYSALEAGVNGYLCKPFELKDLEKILAGTVRRTA